MSVKQIDVPFAASEGATPRSVPVFYAVENRTDDCVQIFRCKVGLPEHKIPDWMQPGHFELITHIIGDLQLVDYNASLQHHFTSRQAEAFRYKVYSEIFFREQHLKENVFFAC